MFRAFCTCPVIWPKLVGLVISRPGGPQLAWLKALKNSVRNWRYLDSVKLKFLPTEASKLKKLGARKVPTPADPSVPTAGMPKAQVPLSTPAAQKFEAVTTPKNW